MLATSWSPPCTCSSRRPSPSPRRERGRRWDDCRHSAGPGAPSRPPHWPTASPPPPLHFLHAGGRNCRLACRSRLCTRELWEPEKCWCIIRLPVLLVDSCNLTWSPGTLGVMLQGRLVIIPSTVSTDSRGTARENINKITRDGRDLSPLTRS